MLKIRIPIAPYNAVQPTRPNGKPNPGYGRFGLNKHIWNIETYREVVDAYFWNYVPLFEQLGVLDHVVQYAIMPFGRSPNLVPFANGMTGYRIDQFVELSREYRWLIAAVGETFLSSETRVSFFLGGHPPMGFAKAGIETITENIPCVFDAAATQPDDSPLIRDIINSDQTHLIEANGINLDYVIPRAADWELWSKADSKKRLTIRDAPDGSCVDYRNGIQTEEQLDFAIQALDYGLDISLNMLKTPTKNIIKLFDYYVGHLPM